VTICEGSSFEGHDSKGSYIDRFSSVAGCDSIRRFNLTILPTLRTTTNISVCRGVSYRGHKEQGTYIDTLTSHSGCDSIDLLQLTVKECLSLPTSPVKESKQLLISPNPASDYLTIQWSGQEQFQYSIYSLSGKLMQQQQDFNSNKKVVLRNYPAGAYLLQVRSKKHFAEQKIILVK